MEGQRETVEAWLLLHSDPEQVPCSHNRGSFFACAGSRGLRLSRVLCVCCGALSAVCVLCGALCEDGSAWQRCCGATCRRASCQISACQWSTGGCGTTAGPWCWAGGSSCCAPSSTSPTTGTDRETRWFATWKRRGAFEDFSLPPCVADVAGQETVPFGDAMLRFSDAYAPPPAPISPCLAVPPASPYSCHTFASSGSPVPCHRCHMNSTVVSPSGASVSFSRAPTRR